MNLHDKSQQRGLAFLIGILLFIVIWIFSKSDNPKPTPLLKAPTVAEVQSYPAAETGYVNTMDSQGDIYNDREELLRKLQNIDPSADFSGSYSEGSDKTDDNFDGDDMYGFDIQVTGSKQHIKEVNFTYRKSAVEGNGPFAYKTFISLSELFCGQGGKKWSDRHLELIRNHKKKSRIDSVIIDGKKLLMDYDQKYQSITLYIKHG